MNIKTLKSGALLICTVFLFMIPGCSKDEPTQPAPVNNRLILAETEATPYQFVTVQMPQGMLPIDPLAMNIPLKIGDKEVMGSRLISQDLDERFGQGNYFTYLFAMPEMNQGKYPINIQAAGGRVGEAEISVKPLLVTTTPEVYIADYKQELEQNNELSFQDLENRVADSSISKSLADSIKSFINKSYSDLANELALLSPEQKFIYVQTVEANKHWIDEYNKAVDAFPLVGKDHDKFTWECFEHKKMAKNAEYFGMEREAEEEWLKYNQCRTKYAAYRQSETNAYAKRVQTAYEQAKKEAASNSNWLFAGRAFVKTFISSAAKGLIEEKYGSDVFDEPSTPVNLDDVQKKKGSLAFEPDKEYDLGALLTVVNVNRDDIGLPGFKEIINGIDEYNRIWSS